jgi:hypothetical protein
MGDVDCCRVTPSEEYERLSGAGAIPRAYYQELEDLEPESYPAIVVLTDIEDDNYDDEEDANTDVPTPVTSDKEGSGEEGESESNEE